MFDLFSAKRRRTLLPWEYGIAAIVLGKGSAQQDVLVNPRWDDDFLLAAAVSLDDEKPLPKASVDLVAMQKFVPTLSRFAFTAVGRKKTTIPWSAKVADERKIAMERWRLIIMQNPQGSIVGRQLLEAHSESNGGEVAGRIIEDTFGIKATRTLEQRSGSLLTYGRWLAGEDGSATILPFEEKWVYKYLCMLRTEKAAPTRGTKFRESIAFSHGVLGAFGALTAMSSRRCQGSAALSMITKSKHKQMDPVFVEQVEAFENGVFELESEVDRIHSGNACVLIHFRGRFSDLYYCSSEPKLDEPPGKEGYIEAAVSDTKVTRRDKRRMCLPLVGHSRGLLGRAWGREYLRLRAKHGLDATNGPLMVAVKADGTFTSSRLRSHEAVVWWREILLKLGCPIRPLQLFGSHSFKATLLSWLAKAGVPLSTRAILGYHASGSGETAILYSRDAVAGPLRSLHKLLMHVRAKRFDPDCTRSGRWLLEDKVAATQLIEEDTVFPWDNSEGGDLTSVSCDEAVPPPTNRASGSGDIPGIDNDFPVGFVENLISEPEEDDGFGPDSFICKLCKAEYKAEFCLRDCSKCEMSGCIRCLPVSVHDAELLCEVCKEASPCDAGATAFYFCLMN